MEFPFDVAGLLGAPAGREGPSGTQDSRHILPTSPQKRKLPCGRLVGLVEEGHLRVDNGMLSTVLEARSSRLSVLPPEMFS